MVRDCTELRDPRLLIRLRIGVVALLALLAVCPMPAGATATDYRLEAQPLWHGLVKSGTDTEVHLRLLSGSDGRAEITLDGSRAQVRTEVALEPGVPVELRLPLAHDRVAPASLTLRPARGVPVQRDLTLDIVPADTRVFAVVGSAASGQWQIPTPVRGSDRLLYLSAGELPAFASSYRLLAALALVGMERLSITPGQSAALAQYLGSCGVLYLSDVAAELVARLRASAGCGGRNLIIQQAGAAGAAPVAVASPGSATMNTLLDGSDTLVVRSVLVFFVGYLCLLLILSRSAKSWVPLLVLPPLATALAVAGWSLAAPRWRAVSLAEMDSGDTVARYTLLMRLAGASRSEQWLPLDYRWGIPVGGDIRTPPELQYRGAEAALHLPTRVLSQHELLVHGVTAAPRLELSAGTWGAEVINRGDGLSPPGTVAWNGSAYRLPPLEAGETWRSPVQADTWGSTAAQQVLRQRAVDGSTWMLLPFQVAAPGIAATAQQADGWLLVRGGSDV